MREDLLYRVEGGVAFLTINRPDKRNAISQEMIALFRDFLAWADADEAVHAVCIDAAGDRAFSAGADLALTFTDETGDRLGGTRNYAALLKELSHYGKPLVAKVNGVCLAGGLGIMLSADIVITRDDVSFWTPEVNVGIFPMMIGALLMRHVGPKKLMEMVLTGRKVPAREAEAMGLVTRAVPPDELDAAVAAVLEGLTKKSTIGLRIGKEAFRAVVDAPFDEAVETLCEALGRAIATEDAMEGMVAFLQKRAPEFKGR